MQQNNLQPDDIIRLTLKANQQLQQQLQLILHNHQSSYSQSPLTTPLLQKNKQLEHQNKILEQDNQFLAVQLKALRLQLKQVKKQNNKLKEYNIFLQDCNGVLKQQITLLISHKKHANEDETFLQLNNKINHLKQSLSFKQQSINLINSANIPIRLHQNYKEIKINQKPLQSKIKRQLFKTQYQGSSRQVKNKCTSCNYKTSRFKNKKSCFCQNGKQCMDEDSISRDRKTSLIQWSRSSCFSSDQN